MTRMALIVLVIGLVFYAGTQWDSKKDLQKKIDIKDAIDENRDSCDDAPWFERVLNCF